VSEAISLAFFDRARQLHGTARSALTLLFDGSEPNVTASGPEVEPKGSGGYSARLAGRFELAFTPLSEEVSLAGSRVQICRVEGTLDGRGVDCLGTAARTVKPPEWAELDVLRAISALFDEENAVLAVGRRPRGALGHGEELVTGWLLTGGELRSVEDARISTVYNGDGRQRSAGLELWLPGEDFPRRAAGEVAAGTTLELPGLLVNASVFRWRMEGREGIGAYELTARTEPPEAA
jgi:hypothetical protein